MRGLASNVLKYRDYKESEEVINCQAGCKPSTVVLMLDNSDIEMAAALQDQLVNLLKYRQIESNKVHFITEIQILSPWSSFSFYPIREI